MLVVSILLILVGLIGYIICCIISIARLEYTPVWIGIAIFVSCSTLALVVVFIDSPRAKYRNTE